MKINNRKLIRNIIICLVLALLVNVGYVAYVTYRSEQVTKEKADKKFLMDYLCLEKGHNSETCTEYISDKIIYGDGLTGN